MGGNCVSSFTFQICIFFLYKKSFMGYKLIALDLQVNFKNGLGKFSLKCTYSWFRGTRMRCGIGVHRLGPQHMGRNCVYSCTFQICELLLLQEVFYGL